MVKTTTAPATMPSRVPRTQFSRTGIASAGGSDASGVDSGVVLIAATGSWSKRDFSGGPRPVLVGGAAVDVDVRSVRPSGSFLRRRPAAVLGPVLGGGGDLFQRPLQADAVLF